MENCHPIFMNGGVEFQFTNGSIYFEIVRNRNKEPRGFNPVLLLNEDDTPGPEIMRVRNSLQTLLVTKYENLQFQNNEFHPS